MNRAKTRLAQGAGILPQVAFKGRQKVKPQGNRMNAIGFASDGMKLPYGVGETACLPASPLTRGD
jgi:hypothetical protein